MSMSILVHCPECASAWNLADHLAGKSVRCPTCKAAMQVGQVPRQDISQMTRCPFCAEEIRPEAIKCRHCGEMLQGGHLPQSEEDSFGVSSPMESGNLRRFRAKSDPGMRAVGFAVFLGLLATGAGLLVSQYFPVFGEAEKRFLAAGIIEPWSPALNSGIAIHCFVFGAVGAVLGGLAGYLTASR